MKITPNEESKEDLKKCMEIKKKLEEIWALALKADKINAIIVIDRSDYIKKTEDFIWENSFKELPNDPREKYQKELSDAVKKCYTVIAEECRPRMIILNSKATVMKGNPRIHKKY